jgi:hypothetical protein
VLIALLKISQLPYLIWVLQIQRFTNSLNSLINDGLVIYVKDDELILSDHQMTTRTLPASAASPVGSECVWYCS